VRGWASGGMEYDEVPAGVPGAHLETDSHWTITLEGNSKMLRAAHRPSDDDATFITHTHTDRHYVSRAAPTIHIIMYNDMRRSIVFAAHYFSCLAARSLAGGGDAQNLNISYVRLGFSPEQERKCP
jgi:hypothetical protein